MNILSAQNLSKTYGIRTLFQDVTLHITDTDRMGLIGINGTGKSSLLRILAGLESPDAGTLTPCVSPLRVEFLPQDPECDPKATVLEQVFRSDAPLMTLIRSYEEALEAAESNPLSPEAQERLLQLTARMNAADAWEAESQVKTVLTRLGIRDYHAPMGTLSGGQKKRVALAGVLIAPCDLLILDEPTNHMDSAAIDWLETYLKNRKGALLMVTHDRYFLDRVANRTIELDRGQLFSYPGNYSYFVEKRLERRALEASLERKRENLYRRELEWVRRGAQARTTKQKARLQRFDALEAAAPGPEQGELEVSVSGARLGKKIMEAVGLTKGFDGRILIRDFSYIFLRGDRIGIIGDNGMGKTTLLNLLTGSLTPDAGQVETGPTVRISYITQGVEAMDPTLRAIEYIRQTAEYVTTADGSRVTAAQMMEQFLFTGDMQYTYIGKLSGGERRRLYFLQMLMLGPNVLILDEPTNDLDIDTLTVLEEFIEQFAGVVITVSHDRYFLDRICNRIFSFEGDGRILIHTGNYSDTMAYRRELDALADKPASPKAQTRDAAPDAPARKRKLSYKEQTELEALPGQLAAIEARLAALEGELASHGTDFVKLQALTEEKNALEDDLLAKLERQEELEALQAGFKEQ